MARITARQAHTRAKYKRNVKRNDTSKAHSEARNRYIRQLWNAGIAVQDENNEDRKIPPGKLINKEKGLRLQKNSKITDFFTVKSARIQTMPDPRNHSKRNCIEIITLDNDDDDDTSDRNNNMPPHLREPAEIKPLSHRRSINAADLGSSFRDLNLSVTVDEDIEIVEMLPPIPLRNHPVFDIDESV